MHIPFDYIFDSIMALAWCKCSGGAWCSAFIYKTEIFCDLQFPFLLTYLLLKVILL